VTGPGIDLVTDDPKQALALLTDAHQQLDAAAAANVSAAVIAPLRAQTNAGLDRLYGVVPVSSTLIAQVNPAKGGAPTDLDAMVQGPDAVPYVIDGASKSVYRIDLKTKKATVVVRAGQKASGLTVGTPRYLAVGGLDLLILDTKNVLWRWRPADATGRGTLTRVTLQGAASLGNDIMGINTFLRPGTRGLYNLYVVDPSEQQIRAYSPAADGDGFPAKPNAWLATARDVSGITSTYVDGDLFATDGGTMVRFVGGKDEGWEANAPKDTLVRPAPQYSIVTSGTERRTGEIYGFDAPNDRIIALDKVDGTYRTQYRLAGGATDWSDLRAMYVVAGLDQAPSTVIWMSRDGVHEAVLVAVPDDQTQPSPSVQPSASSPPVKATPKPTKKS
jgi:hypothetical protein